MMLTSIDNLVDFCSTVPFIEGVSVLDYDPPVASDDEDDFEWEEVEDDDDIDDDWDEDEWDDEDDYEDDDDGEEWDEDWDDDFDDEDC